MYLIKQLSGDFIVEEIPLFKFSDKGEYTYLLLEKKDYDTEKAVQKISEYLNIPRKRFSYAGSKDRFAVTKQFISVKGKIDGADFKDFSIKVAGYGDCPISLGDLKGNRFIIVARNITEKPKKTDFLVNYFDEQRFGRNNLEIGLAIIKDDFRKAAGLVDLEETKRHLEKYNNDFVGAIKKVPFKIINMYIHAVQSYLWNEAAGAYIKKSIKDFYEVNYQHGTFIFPKKKVENVELPLVTFDTEFNDKNIEKIYSDILAKNNITLRDFIIRKMPDITPQGNSRNLIEPVRFMKVSKLEDDELNKGMKKAELSFELNKGCYATIVVRYACRE